MPEPESLIRGASDIQRIWFMGSLLEIVAAAGDTGGEYSLVLQTIPPGLNPAPPHRHADKDEAFYVLDGALTVRVGERTVEAATGSFLSIRHGVVHGIWNNGAAPASLLALFHPAVPDLVHTTDELIAEGDKVTMRGSSRGTHRGDLMGIPATGKPIHWQEIFVYRIADGRLAEEWGQMDMVGLPQQIGAMPTPQHAPA